MSPEPIPVRPVQTIECRHCGAGAPVDDHFCGQCDKILALGRHGDFFTFFGLPRTLTVDRAALERTFRELSRKFHPDYFYNAERAEKLASLERTSYLNDAYRTLRDPVRRLEYLLSLEGLPPVSQTGGGEAPVVPPALLEEVFALNEELDEIREAREEGTADAAALAGRLDAARAPIGQRREAHEARLVELSARFDTLAGGAPERAATLAALRELLLERQYLANLMATIDREAQALEGTA
jgi:molecular chaperone HscB